MIAGVADTHTVIWYLFDDERLSPTAGTFIDETAGAGDRIAVSSISLAEIVYLVEKGRLAQDVYFRRDAADIGSRGNHAWCRAKKFLTCLTGLSPRQRFI